MNQVMESPARSRVGNLPRNPKEIQENHTRGCNLSIKFYLNGIDYYKLFGRRIVGKYSFKYFSQCFTLEDIVKYRIVHEKSGLFASFFRNISKTVETILIKQLSEAMSIWSRKKND